MFTFARTAPNAKRKNRTLSQIDWDSTEADASPRNDVINDKWKEMTPYPVLLSPQILFYFLISE